MHLAAGYSPRITAPRVKGGRTWGPEDLGDLGNLSGLGAYSSNTILESSCSVIACFRWYPSNPETAIICRGVVCSSQGYHRSYHVLPTASYSNLLKPNIEPKKVFWIWCSLISYQNIIEYSYVLPPLGSHLVSGPVIHMLNPRCSPRPSKPCLGLVTDGRRWVCLQLQQQLAISSALDISRKETWTEWSHGWSNGPLGDGLKMIKVY